MSKSAAVTEPSWRAVTLNAAASSDVPSALDLLDTSEAGLTASEAALRLREGGPNAVISHGARPLQVFIRQLKNRKGPLTCCGYYPA